MSGVEYGERVRVLRSGLLTGKIPHFDVAVVAPRHNLILGECKASDWPAVTNESGRVPPFFARPDLDGPVVAASHQPQLVARDGPDTLDMSKQRLRRLA